MNAILKFEQVSFSIHHQSILSNLSFELECGSITSIIGPNGAGKSSLLKLITRINKNQSGTIHINNQSEKSTYRTLSELSPKERARLISYVPQSFDHSTIYSAYEFVLLSRYPHLNAWNSLSPRDYAAADNALTLTGCHEFKSKTLTTLSGGQRQKVMIAAALAQEASIMLLDEPTTYLDPHHCDEILELLKKINHEKNVTILSVTHDINHAALISDKILALKNGRLAFEGSAEECMQTKVLEGIYDQKFTLVQHPARQINMMIPN